MLRLNKNIPVKTFIGVPSSWIISGKDVRRFAELERVVPEIPAIEILSWVNGKRTLLEIYNYLKYKYEVAPVKLERWFKLAVKYKYIKLEKNNRIPVEILIKDLKKMGIKKGDTILVHSALGSIGTVEGGADGVVEALIKSVSKSGLVIVPTLTSTYSGGLYAFNPGKTPSRVGEITNALLKREDAFRSSHPTHSLAAVGKNAEEFVKGHTTSTFSKESPFGKYVKRNAKILFIGTGVVCNTTLHAVEDWLDLPYLTTGKAFVEDAWGREKMVDVTKFPSGCRDFYKQDSKIEKAFMKKGVIKKGRLGKAKVLLLNARDVVNNLVKIIESGAADILLCDKPECEFCKNGKKLLEKNKNIIRKNIAKLRSEGFCD